MLIRAFVAAALAFGPGMLRAQGPSTDALPALRALSARLEKAPDDPSKRQVLLLLDSIARDAESRPEDSRAAALARGIGAFASAAESLSGPPELLKEVRSGAAALSNRAGRWEEGRRLADSVLAADPRDHDALVQRSNANYHLRNYELAFGDADRAAKSAPDSGSAYTARALAAYGLGDFQQTLEDARRALALDAGDQIAFSLLKLAEGRVPAAARTDAAAAVRREYHEMVSQLGAAEARSRRSDGPIAAPAVDRLLKEAASRLSVKDYWGALALTEKALAAAPESAAAYYYQAAAYNLLGRYEDAAASASQSLALNPSDAAARDARAWAWNHLGRFQDALADANHALELDPKNAYAFANRGFAHEKIGRVEEMLADLQSAARLNPQFEPLYKEAAAINGRGNPQGSRTARAKRERFLMVLAGSFGGGLLLALGLLRLSRKTKPAPSRRTSAIDRTYEIGRVLGEGGMGLVYEAVDRALRRRVAVKALRAELRLDAEAKAAFLEEARTVAALHHPGIVDIHSIVEDEAGLYLVFEYIEGLTVFDLLSRKGRLTLTEAKAIMKTVCAALEFAHEHDVVHRDLKPSNIMVTELGQVKVMDFGVSRHVKDAVRAKAAAGSAAGTPDYMAPEQEHGAVRPESDVFSLGVCLYEMLTGRRPYPPPADAFMKVSRGYAKPSALDPALAPLDELLDAALDPDPDRRIASAREFWARLNAIRS